MTTNFHTPLPFGSPASSTAFNSVFSQLDSGISSGVTSGINTLRTQLTTGVTPFTNISVTGGSISGVSGSFTTLSVSGVSNFSSTTNFLANAVVKRTTTSNILQIASYSDTPASNFLLGFKARNTEASPSATQNSDQLLIIGTGGWDTTALVQSSQIIFRATENYSTTARGSEIVFRTTQNGTTTLSDGMILNNAKALRIIGNFAANNKTPAAPAAWGLPTGTAARTTFATGSVTLAQLAQRVYALIEDLSNSGIINAT